MPNGDTTLHLAIRLKMNQVAKKIIGKFDNFLKAIAKNSGFNPLHEAANQNNSVIVECLLKTGKIDVNTKTSSGDTALHLAANNNCVETI